MWISSRRRAAFSNFSCRGRARASRPSSRSSSDVLVAVQETSAAGGCRGDIPPSRSASCTGPCTGWMRVPAGTAETSATSRLRSSMSRLHVRNLKIFCSTWIAPRRLPALANGPYSFVPRSCGSRVNSTRGKSSRTKISRYGNVLSSFRSWLNFGCTSLISRASTNSASTSLSASRKSMSAISRTRSAVRRSSAAALRK